MADPFSAVMAAGAAGNNSLWSFGMNQFGSALSSKRQWKYTVKAMKLQDRLNRDYTRDSYGLMRAGLEDAGYNPLLALGSHANTSMPSATMSATDSDAGDQAIQTALATQQTKAQVKQADANSSLALQQAETEKSKRTNLEFQNAMLDVQKHLADKDLDSYDRRIYADLYEKFQRAENYRASSAIGAMNAETQRQSVQNQYELGKYHNETERNTYDTGILGLRTRGYSPPQNGKSYQDRIKTDKRSEYGYWN